MSGKWWYTNSAKVGADGEGKYIKLYYTKLDALAIKGLHSMLDKALRSASEIDAVSKEVKAFLKKNKISLKEG
jgi:hypothetical protein